MPILTTTAIPVIEIYDPLLGHLILLSATSWLLFPPSPGMAVMKPVVSRANVLAGAPVNLRGAVTTSEGWRPSLLILRTPAISVIEIYDPLLRHLILLFDTSWMLLPPSPGTKPRKLWCSARC